MGVSVPKCSELGFGLIFIGSKAPIETENLSAQPMWRRLAGLLRPTPIHSPNTMGGAKWTAKHY